MSQCDVSRQLRAMPEISSAQLRRLRYLYRLLCSTPLF
jgi:hypothetical protein